MSLFMGALFPENYTRRGLGQDYLVGMGCGAYDYLADNARKGRHIFAELAGDFSVMLELVAMNQLFLQVIFLECTLDMLKNRVGKLKLSIPLPVIWVDTKICR